MNVGGVGSDKRTTCGGGIIRMSYGACLVCIVRCGDKFQSFV